MFKEYNFRNANAENKIKEFITESTTMTFEEQDKWQEIAYIIRKGCYSLNNNGKDIKW